MTAVPNPALIERRYSLNPRKKPLHSPAGLVSLRAHLRRDGRVAEGTALLKLHRGNSIEGSNPSLSAILVGNPKDGLTMDFTDGLG